MSAAERKGNREAASSARIVSGFQPATALPMATHGRKTPADPNLGMRIELLRRRLGLTQVQLGELSGVTGSNISHWETARFVPPTEVLPRLAAALKTTQAWLMGEHLTDDGMRAREALLLRLLLDGGERLEALLERFESPEALIRHLETFDPTSQQ